MPKRIVEMYEGGGEARLVLGGFEINMRKTPNGLALAKMQNETMVAEKEILEITDEQARLSYKAIEDSFGPSLFGCFAMIFGRREQLFEDVAAYSMGPPLQGKTPSIQMVITVYGKR